MDGYFVHIANRIDKIRRGDDENKGSNPGIFGNVKRELCSWDLWRAVFAEFLATFLFVFIGTMSAVAIVPADDLAGKFIRIAFAFCLMITVCIQMFGHVSGGHLNPAVSMAVVIEISPYRALLYTTAQIIGGILGSLMLKGVSPSRLHENLGLTSVHDDLTGGQAFACELIFTFVLVFSIFGTTDPNRALLGNPVLGIGLTVGVVHLAAIPFTGASMNPARSLASAVVASSSEAFDKHWVAYLLL